MKIDERKALNTQKPNTDKVYETNTKVSRRTAKPSSAARRRSKSRPTRSG